MTETGNESAVALIGMSGRFPGAVGVVELWRNLRAGIAGLREITDDELSAAGVDTATRADPQYVRVGGPVANLDTFDAGVFGFNPREAETMEPQHRLFLECSWEALESAGYCPTEPGGLVGVFAGSGFPDYMIRNVLHLVDEPGGGLLLAVGNERDSLASLVSYKLGLRGPSLSVQTFCSTSLVAVHLACQSLLTYECDMAIAGGAFLPLPQPTGYRYEQGGILSPDGHVRSFDSAANGTVMGSGVGVVALKRMVDAIADGDLIHAVILGSAINNDGRERVGYTAPGVDGQAAVIETALSVAGAKPETIGYVECHATGTMLGDSIELAAMNRVFQTIPEQPCVLGTLKPSLGHLDRASGVTGLIRAAMCLRDEILPGTPNYDSPNPALATASNRFKVLTADQPWPANDQPRRAGVSSFGLGGTNAHVVMEQAPVRPARPARPSPHLLTFSAADPEVLRTVTEQLRQHLIEHPDADVADVAFTLQVSRGRFAVRRAVVVRDHADAIAALSDPARWIDGETGKRDPRVRLVTSGPAPAALVAAAQFLLGAENVRDDAAATVANGLARVGVRISDDANVTEVVEVPPTTPDVSDPQQAAEWLLATVARLWQAGSSIDWSALHRGEGRRVELPTYPFQRRRYWVNASQVQQQPVIGRVDDVSKWTHLPAWQHHPLPADVDADLRAAGPWLVLSADSHGEELIERLTSAGAEVIAARLGDRFDSDEAGDFTAAPADLHELLQSILVAPRTIVNQWPSFDAAMALAGSLTPETTTLVLLTSGAVSVAGADLTNPDAAAIAALAPTLAQENPHLTCRHIDVDTGMAAVLAAIAAPHAGPIAVRSGETWLRTYQQFPLEKPQQPPLSAGDTVLITGGLGDVGLTLARHLAQHGCNLVLTARSEIPPREQWSELPDDIPARTVRHITNILELEQQGATVLAMSADVADGSRMQSVVDAAVARFGRIDAVVHGAGVQDQRYFNLLQNSTTQECEAHLRAKVGGFKVLQTVLKGQCPDRRITLSSLASVLGGICLGPYAAANAALDAYARAARIAGEGNWVTVDWDTWAIDETRLEAHGPSVREYEMLPSEGIDVLERALSASDRIGHVVISTGPIEPRLTQWVTGSAANAPIGSDNRERYPRPSLSTPYVEPADGLEQTLAEIWAAGLGLEQVGAQDNFFELGGHSLIAIQLATRIRNTVSAPLAVTALVEYPTVRELAAMIQEGQS